MHETETFYHGSTVLFPSFDLDHALEGAGKVKFGYGVYVTSHYSSAAHYADSKDDPNAPHYVYTVEVPAITDENYIAFREEVKPIVLSRAESKLGCEIPAKAKADGKEFRKFLAKTLTGKTDLEAEKAASKFLVSIGVEMIIWPYSWTNPAKGTNRAILDERKVKITKVEQVELNAKKQLIEGSQKEIALSDCSKLI